MLGFAGRQSNGTSLQKSTFKVVEEIRRVLNTDAKTDEILWETTSSTDCGVNGRVPLINTTNISLCFA